MTTLSLDRATERFAATDVAAPTAFTKVRDVLTALGEGLTAYHRYERLRARGIPHADAARLSFDLDTRA